MIMIVIVIMIITAVCSSRVGAGKGRSGNSGMYVGEDISYNPEKGI